MERRLLLFLQMEQLSHAQFADKIGIQRSGVYHILSGRNKPSYDFITNMLKAFPTLNSEWLLLGIGKPYKDKTAVDLFSAPTSEPIQAPTATASDNLLSEPIIEANLDEIITPSEPLSSSITEQKPTEAVQKVSSIAKIIVLYEDGRYETR
jgi:transcriptional regulator with XRE-family HTH domain